MRDIRVGAAQFEHRDNDKAYNLSRIHELTRRAVDRGAEIVSFHECAIPGYSWLQPLSHLQLLEVAEPVPDGESITRLIRIAKEFKTVIMAGLLERDEHNNVYNCYVTVDPRRMDHAFSQAACVRQSSPFLGRLVQRAGDRRLQDRVLDLL